jgi:transcriptional regulator with XRE-family HTH domain
MEDVTLRNRIGSNIASYRKQAGLTQAALAEQLNYTDKAVSKLERGESIPDVLTLDALARRLGITVNDLLQDPNVLPENQGPVQQTMGRVVERALKRKANKNIILGLSSLLVWFVALLIFVVLNSIGIDNAFLAFFFAIPADAITMLSLRSAWRDFRWNRFLISVIMWGGVLSIYTTLLTLASLNIWMMFLLCLPGQAAILLWFKLFRPLTEEETHG